MSIKKSAYSALESVVGSKYISDDPALCDLADMRAASDTSG
jgi:hypothetical protein